MMFYVSIIKILKRLGISLFRSGCHFVTAYWFAMKLCTDYLEGFLIT